MAPEGKRRAEAQKHQLGNAVKEVLPMTPEELDQEELMRFRIHCANTHLCVWYFWVDGEELRDYHTEPIEQAG